MIIFNPLKEKREKKLLIFSIILLVLLAGCVPIQSGITVKKEGVFSSLYEFYSKDNGKKMNMNKVGDRYILSEDLIIQPGTSLDINNEILEINCLSYRCGIHVYGTLNVINKSTITTADKNKGYQFWYKKRSNGKIENSIIEYSWTVEGKFDEAGIFVESDNFKISDSTIQYSKGNGIEFQGRNILIHNSIFQNNGASGVEVFSTDTPAYFEIYNNTINNNGIVEARMDGCGILIDNSQGLVYNNTIFENRYCGFESDCQKLNTSCMIKVYNNNIYNNSHDGLFVHENSDVTAYGNIIKSNRRGVSIDNYQTGRTTKLNLYNNTINANQIGIEITGNYDTAVRITKNVIDKNEMVTKVQNSNPKIFDNLINGEQV